MKPIGLDDLKDGMSAEELSAEPTPEVQPPAEPEPTPEVIPPQEPKPVEEPKGEEPKPEPTPKPEPVQEFDLEFFNKTLSKDYKTVDEITAALNKPTMEAEYKELEAKNSDLQKLYDENVQKFDLLTEQLDPTNLFSEDDMKLAVLKKANPKMDVSIAQKVFATEDLTTIDDLEMVKMGWKFNSPKGLKGTEKDLDASIAEELGQDPDTPVSEWSVSAQNRLSRMAGESVSQFEQLKSGVELPKKIDMETLRTQRTTEQEEAATLLKEGWEQTTKETLSELKSLKVPIGAPAEGEEQKYFEWELGKVPQEEADSLKEQYIKSGLNPEDMKESYERGLKLTLIDANLPQLMQKYGEDIEARMKEEFLDKSHNPAPLKDTVREEPTGSEKEKKERSSFALDGMSSSFHGHPLFKKS